MLDIGGKSLFVLYSGKNSAGEFNQQIVPTAPTVIFIHGLGSSHNFYYAVATSVLEYANCVLFDTEGAGLSPLQSDKITVESVGHDIVQIMAKLQIEKAILVGHSMGGMIALKLAQTRPDIIKGVIALGPVHPSDALRAGIQARHDLVAKSQSLADAATMIANGALGSKALPRHRAMVRSLVCQQTPAGYVANCQLIIQAQAPDYSKIIPPVVFICGSDDKTAPYKGGVELIQSALTTETAHYDLEGVGHWHCVEDEQKIAPLIGELVQGPLFKK